MKQLTLTVQSCEKVKEKCKGKYRLGASYSGASLKNKKLNGLRKPKG